MNDEYYDPKLATLKIQLKRVYIVKKNYIGHMISSKYGGYFPYSEFRG